MAFFQHILIFILIRCPSHCETWTTFEWIRSSSTDRTTTSIRRSSSKTGKSTRTVWAKRFVCLEPVIILWKRTICRTSSTAASWFKLWYESEEYGNVQLKIKWIFCIDAFLTIFNINNKFLRYFWFQFRCSN